MQPRTRGQIPLSVALLLGLLTLTTLILFTSRSPQRSEKIELVVWNLHFLSPDVALVLHQFEQQNPTIRVIHSASVAPNTTADGQRLLTAIAGNVPPDLMLFDRYAIGEWAARNAFTNLTPLLQTQSSTDPNYINLSDYYPWTLTEASYRPPRSHQPEGLFGLPVTIDLRLLYCNTTHLRQAAIPPPRTWEDLHSAALTLTQRNQDHTITRLGFAPLYGNSWLYLYAWQAGANFLSEDGTRVTLNTPETRRALKYITTLYDDLGGAANVNGFQSSFSTGLLDPFVRGQVSMKIDSTYALTVMAEANRNLDFTAVPAPLPADRLAAGEKPLTWAGGFSFVIPATSPNKDAAFKLMQFLLSEKTYRFLQQANREALAAEGRLFLPEPHPNRRFFETAERELVQNDPSISSNIKHAYAVIKSLLPSARIRPPTPIAQVLWTQQARATDTVINHIHAKQFPNLDAEIDHALATAEKIAQSQLDEFLSPPPPNIVNWLPWFAAFALLPISALIALSIAYRRNNKTHAYNAPELAAASLFLSPWLLGLLTLTAGPILFSIVLSFTRYDVLSPARYVGLANYRAILSDDLFYKSLTNTAVMTLRLPLTMATGLAIALLLNHPLRTIGIYRTAFFLPSIVPAVAASLLWLILLNPTFGLINLALSHICTPPAWLQDPAWSKPSLILMSLWTAGGGMIIWLAGLQSIPPQLYESAKIDGANTLQRFRHITLPMLSPYILFNSIIGLIATFQIFSESYIMTSGGPADSTLFYAYHLFRTAFQFFQLGQASALAWILFAIVLTLTLLQLKLAKHWVHYDRT